MYEYCSYIELINIYLIASMYGNNLFSDKEAAPPKTKCSYEIMPTDKHVLQRNTWMDVYMQACFQTLAFTWNFELSLFHER